LWLIFLELTLFRFLLQFNFDYHAIFLSALWALGWAMIVLSGVVYLPILLRTGLGLILIAGYNVFDSLQSSNPIWSILDRPNFIVHSPEHSVFVGYALTPWIGVTAAGYSLGQVYAWAPQRRRTFLLRILD
jgi:uncharacterized membrane protein